MADEEFNWGSLDGRLLLIAPGYGGEPELRADVLVLDGDDAGEVYSGVVVSEPVVRSQLVPGGGDLVLGRLGYSRRAGKESLLVLNPGTPSDVEIAKWFIRDENAQSVIIGAPSR